MRIILYTGKGGVGKTTVSAATALAVAAKGLRTLVISTDTAHSLSDALEVPIGREVRRIATNLWGQEVDALYQLEKYWGVLRRYISSVLRARGLDDVVADELANLPGMEEIASLMQLTAVAREDRFDVVIVDCAPTGETMQLLSFPEMARWWLEKLFPIHRAVTRVARPVVQPFVDIPLPTDDVFTAVRDLILNVGEMRGLLADPATTSIRLVVNLEKIVIKETQRAYTYFSLFGYATDAVVINRALPQTVDGQFLQTWAQAQRRYREMVHEAFAPLPILELPLAEQEIVGRHRLLDAARILYAGHEPADRLYTGILQKVERKGKRYILSIATPFTERGKVDISQKGDELMVRVGAYKRNLSLPRALAGLQADEARLDGERLLITFGKEATADG
ncbi:MAG TPA: TRC40/GET3/ArsA family transport-energizing ATPase [bacterium]|nr:TRC40/GET3/ArsA family transport-energizing ATPase [bacterium]